MLSKQPLLSGSLPSMSAVQRGYQLFVIPPLQTKRYVSILSGDVSLAEGLYMLVLMVIVDYVSLISALNFTNLLCLM